MFKSSIVIGLLRQKFSGQPSQASDDQLFLYDKNLNAMRFGDQTIELEATENVEDQAPAVQVKNGACQQVAGLEVFDLAALERYLGEDQEKSKLFTPLHSQADVEEATKAAFQYNICLPDFRLKEGRDMQVGECESNNKAMGSWKAAAFMSNADPKAGGNITERVCKYTFDGPMFEGIPDTDPKKKMMKGYSLTYKSGEACEGDKKFQYKMNILCNREAKHGSKFEMVGGDACTAEMNFEGQEGCAFDLNITKYLEPLSEFFGFFEVAIGIFMCFLGSKFVPMTFSTLIFLMVNGIVMGLAYNMQIMVDPATYELNVPVSVGVALVSIALGVAAGYYSYKFAKDYAVALLAGWVGGALVTLILTPVTSLQGQVKVVIIFVSVLLSIYFAKLANKYIKSIGTAFIGSFLMMYGIGQELGGFPPIFSYGKDFDFDSQTMNGLSTPYIAYMSGFVFFTCVGGFVQLKYVVDEDDHTDQDDVFNQKHA